LPGKKSLCTERPEHTYASCGARDKFGDFRAALPETRARSGAAS
jgi:hypothetical protein